MQDEGSHNNHEDAAGTLALILRSVTSSENNALILEELLRGKRDELRIISAHNDDYDEDGSAYWNKYFVLRDGDDLCCLGNLIKMSTSLKTLILDDMPADDSFRGGLAANKSIQILEIYRDLGEEDFRSLAPFFQNTHTLQKLSLFWANLSRESMKSFTSLLRQRQIPSLKTIYLECNYWEDNEMSEFARALSMQPQLEGLDINETYFGDEAIVALAEGMEMCTNLEFLDFAHAGEVITEVGLNALSSLFQSKKFLSDIRLACMHITNAGMTALAPGLASLKSLKRLEMRGNNIGDEGLKVLAAALPNFFHLECLGLGENSIGHEGLKALAAARPKFHRLKYLDLSRNNIGDEGLKALAAARPKFHRLEKLDLRSNNIGDEGLKALANAQFDVHNLDKLDLSENNIGEEGLKALSSVLQTVSRLRDLNLYSNSIDDEGLHAFLMEMKDQCTIEDLNLSRNAISCGVRSLAGMTSLRRLKLRGTNIGNSVGAMTALAESMANLPNLVYLSLSRVSSSGLPVLAPVFQSDSFSLQALNLCGIEMDDSGAIALANGLKGNKSLKHVYFDPWTLTDVGLSAFERLLCDTSSVNNTYLSNHTLERIGGIDHRHSSIKTLLDLNKKKDSKGCNVPICKILASHSDIDMTPLLQWSLKLLPFMVAWYERAQSSQRWIQPRIAFEGRKLSAMYQFVSGVSYAVIHG